MTSMLTVTQSSVDHLVLSVHQLNLSAKNILEQHFPQIWVKGEVSNLMNAKSGHTYFTLKDEQAQIRCAYFKRFKSSTEGGV